MASLEGSLESAITSSKSDHFAVQITGLNGKIVVAVGLG